MALGMCMFTFGNKMMITMTTRMGTKIDMIVFIVPPADGGDGVSEDSSGRTGPS